MEGGGTRTSRGRMGNRGKGRKGGLELLHKRPLYDPAAFQGPLDGRKFFRAEEYFGYGNRHPVSSFADVCFVAVAVPPIIPNTAGLTNHLFTIAAPATVPTPTIPPTRCLAKLRLQNSIFAGRALHPLAYARPAGHWAR